MTNQKGGSYIPIIFVLILISIFGIYYFGFRHKTTSNTANSPAINPIQTKEPEATKSSYTQDSQFKLQGYYKEYDGTKWEWNNDHVICKSLLVTGGSQDLINDFEKNIEEGNTLNKKINGQLLVNIDPQSLSAIDKQILEKSTPETPIELSVKKWQGGGRSVSTCFSIVEITSIKSLSN